jgi:predicted amidohydrolase YtcJ
MVAIALRRVGILTLLVAICAAPALAEPPPADVVLVNGRIYTVDAAQPWAQAVAIRGDRIVAVGSDAAVAPFKGTATRVIDLNGRLVTPGFIDAHVHFIEGARYLTQLGLRDATTMAQVAQRVADFAHAHPQAPWIRGEGFSYGYPDMPGGAFHKELLDRVAAGRPVLLTSGMAHAAWANSEALKRAGITRATANPAGGEIVRGPDGEPTGWLKEEPAIELVAKHIPEPTAQDDKAALIVAIQEANRVGLTRVDSAGGDFPYFDTLGQIEREGLLTLRLSISDWVHPPALTAEHLAALEAAREKYHDAFLSGGVAKFVMDGVIESHTAYMPGGYADQPKETGTRFWEPAPYKAAVQTLNAHGFQVYTHAIGDGAIDLALDAYEASEASLASAPTTSMPVFHPRNRIEHVEAPRPADIARFGHLDVIASMQPLMIYPRDEWKGMEGLWQKYAGDQWLPVAFALRSFLDAHAVLAFGTDWPIVQLNPLYGIRNAVLRQSLDGQPPGGYLPQQRISVAEAVRAYTLDAAYASHRDEVEGSIAPGKFADLVVFSKNWVEGDPDHIPDAKVVATMVGGRTVYSAVGY